MVIAGTSPDDRLVEVVEIADHPWFVASQFHPELKSRPNHPHPLFAGFVRAALAAAQPDDRTARTALRAYQKTAAAKKHTDLSAIVVPTNKNTSDT